MDTKTFEKIDAIATKLGWNVQVFGEFGENEPPTITFSMYTPEDQDFSFDINGDDDWFDSIYDHWNNFDPEAEAMLWVDPNGKTRNGAPNSIKALIVDMEFVEDQLKKLYEQIVLTDFN